MYNNLLKIEKCYKEEKIVQKEIAFLRRDLSREIYRISFGIRYYYNDYTIKEEYYDVIYRENLQDGSTYYPTEECNSYEEIGSIIHCATKRDSLFTEINAKINK